MRGFQSLVATRFVRQMHCINRSVFGLLVGAGLLVAVGSISALAQFVGPTQLQLVNGWTSSPFGTSHATVEEVTGIVHFKGAIATTGTNPQPFTLPAGFRPATDVFAQVDLCVSTNGRLHIQTSGAVTVEAEGGTFSNAACFTSLDGVSFARNSTGFTALTLINGWTNAPFSTSNAAVRIVTGIVHFKGAIATTGTNPQPFTLPAGFRPATDVFAQVDLCVSTNGRLHIQTSGAVTVEAEGGTFSNAACFTSLDGVSFARNSTGFTALTLINGWTNAPFSTSNAAVRIVTGIVHFKGAIATTGTNPQPFTLPAGFRPATDVFAQVDLCVSTNGRLHIQTSGAVTVEAEGGTFSNAACFTSLDGVSFARNSTGFTALTLINGWTNAPFSTSNAAVRIVTGIVHFKGAIATTGTNPQPFTLPAGFRPATDVFAQVDLCASTNGRLHIQTSGAVTVEAEGGTFSNAGCFTSLDGVSFARNSTGFTALTLINGWTNAPFSTSNAAVRIVTGIVHFEGAIATTGTNPQP